MELSEQTNGTVNGGDDDADDDRTNEQPKKARKNDEKSSVNPRFTFKLHVFVGLSNVLWPIQSNGFERKWILLSFSLVRHSTSRINVCGLTHITIHRFVEQEKMSTENNIKCLMKLKVTESFGWNGNVDG